MTLAIIFMIFTLSPNVCKNSSEGVLQDNYTESVSTEAKEENISFNTANAEFPLFLPAGFSSPRSAIRIQSSL